ncbi:MAG: quinol oxidase [Noviherbaspirillum sp.]
MRTLSWLLVICLYGLSSAPVRADSGPDQDEVVARADSDGVQRVRIVGGEYFFKEKTVVVKVNMPVEFLLRKEAGIVPHTFVIDAPEAGIVLDEEMGTEGKTVAFTPTAVGSYPFYCRNKLLFFKSHRERGMEGVLRVVP